MISIDENGKTNIDNVYAGGDLAESKSTVCRALGSARKAAKSIIENLEKENNMFKEYIISHRDEMIKRLGKMIKYQVN